MRRTALVITLTQLQRDAITRWQRSSRIPLGEARRGRLLLLLEEGMDVLHAARMVGIARHLVYKWVRRFQQEGLPGLRDRRQGNDPVKARAAKGRG